MKKIFYLAVIVLGFVACEKEEGRGGTSTITGTVLVQEYNLDFTIMRDEYPAQDVDVYVIYGNDEVYGDRFQTGYDGKYEFNYLQEGSYKIYVLSKDKTNLLTDELIPVFEDVEITGKDQAVEVPDIIIID